MQLHQKLIEPCDTLNTKAFCVFVRPLLEYCCVIWNPMYKQDITKIEAVQRRFTKRLSGLWNLSYSTRLARLSLVRFGVYPVERDQ